MIKLYNRSLDLAKSGIIVSLLASCGGGGLESDPPSFSTPEENAPIGIPHDNDPVPDPDPLPEPKAPEGYNWFKSGDEDFDVTNMWLRLENGQAFFAEAAESVKNTVSLSDKTVTFGSGSDSAYSRDIYGTGRGDAVDDDDNVVGTIIYFSYNNDYDYVNGIFENEENGGRYLDIFGVPTKSEDMPTSGTAQYKGDAEGNLKFHGQQTINLKSGNSTVNVDFGANDVDVNMSGFYARYEGGALASEWINSSIEIEDMVISDDGLFLDGTVWLRKSGSDVNELSAFSSARSVGGFYGYDIEKNIPDEVAGALAVVDDSGTVLDVMYLAD